MIPDQETLLRHLRSIYGLVEDETIVAIDDHGLMIERAGGRRTYLQPASRREVTLAAELLESEKARERAEKKFNDFLLDPNNLKCGMHPYDMERLGQLTHELVTNQEEESRVRDPAWFVPWDELPECYKATCRLVGAGIWRHESHLELQLLETIRGVLEDCKAAETARDLQIARCEQLTLQVAALHDASVLLKETHS